MDRNGSKSSNDSNIDQTIGSHQSLITSGESTGGQQNTETPIGRTKRRLMKTNG